MSDQPEKNVTLREEQKGILRDYMETQRELKHLDQKEREAAGAAKECRARLESLSHKVLGLVGKGEVRIMRPSSCQPWCIHVNEYGRIAVRRVDDGP